MVSIDTYAIIEIKTSISFVFFSLGVSVAIYISCVVKRRSKVSPDEMPGVYEMNIDGCFSGGGQFFI